MIIYEFTVWVLWTQLTYLRRRWLILTWCLRGTWCCIWTTGSNGCTQECVNISTHPMKTRYVPIQRWSCAGVTGAYVANELSKVPPPDKNTQSRLLACETMKKLFEAELNADYVLFKSGSVFECLGYKVFEKSDTYRIKRFYGVKGVKFPQKVMQLTCQNQYKTHELIGNDLQHNLALSAAVDTAFLLYLYIRCTYSYSWGWGTVWYESGYMFLPVNVPPGTTWG